MGDVMRTEFHQELDELEAALQEEGSLVVRAIRGATNALEHQDVELCDEVVAFDDEIDQRYHDIEKKIELILARQTPVASELRLVLAILHVNIHLERMGDQCVTIAKLTKLSAQLQQSPAPRGGARGDGRPGGGDDPRGARLLRRPGRGAGPTLSELDDLIDRTNRRVIEQVMAIHGDPSAQEWGMRMIVVSRCLERIGDNAVDMGEQTNYLVTGEFHEFTDASHRVDAN